MWDHSWAYWTILAGANAPLYLAAGWLIFRSWPAFWENVRFSFTPEVVSYVRGELSQRLGAEFKLITFIGACALLVVLEHAGLSTLRQALGA
ncbi:MAG TPA: hypothetical protein VFF69_14535 [Phycisphaerales bacterium]|nr:hypothetical protein [Phycisphaerales bacterium]